LWKVFKSKEIGWLFLTSLYFLQYFSLDCVNEAEIMKQNENTIFTKIEIERAYF